MDVPGLRILHLEDNPADAELAREAAARAGLPVQWHTVASPEAFQRALSDEPFDAIVSDSSLAGLDGLEALRQVREDRPGTPFVFLSGNASEQRVRHCLDAGADDYLPKDEPWRLRPTLAHLQQQVQRQRLEREKQGMAVLVDVVRRLSLARRLQEVMDIVRSGARQLTGADGAAFVLRDGDRCFYAEEDAIGPLWKGCRFPMSACISGWAMTHRQTVVVPDIYADPRIPVEAYRPTFVKSLVVAPIRTESPIGAIGYYWARPHAASAEQVALIQALADTTSVAMENVQLFEEMEQRVQARTAELQQVNQELEAFSYSVSHDLRAPLRAIEGYLRLLHERNAQALDGEGLRFLATAQGSAQRMGTLIEDLLKLSQVGRAGLRQRRVDLHALARQAIAGLRDAAPGREVVVEVADPLWVHGDPGLLHVVMENLLSNAWKYTARRHPAHIRVEPCTAPDGSAGFCVRDDGAGFDMAQAAHLFEPFRRLHAESEFSGIGIGLAIVHRIVQRHGGRIWAEARRGEGASFFVVLPPGP